MGADERSAGCGVDVTSVGAAVLRSAVGRHLGVDSRPISVAVSLAPALSQPLDPRP